MLKEEKIEFVDYYFNLNEDIDENIKEEVYSILFLEAEMLEENFETDKIKYIKDAERLKKMAIKIQKLYNKIGVAEAQTVMDETIKKIDEIISTAKQIKNEENAKILKPKIKALKNEAKRMMKTTKKYIKSQNHTILKPILAFLIFNFIGLLIYFGVKRSKQKKFFNELTKVRYDKTMEEAERTKKMYELTDKLLKTQLLEKNNNAKVLEAIKYNSF